MESEKHDVVVAEKEEQLESELSKKLEIAEDVKDEEHENEDSESKLISLINQNFQLPPFEVYPEWESHLISLMIQVISLVRSMDLDAQPKPESKVMSLVTQTLSLFNSMDLDALPKPLSKLISLISKKMSKVSDQRPKSDSDQNSEFMTLLDETLELKPYPELISLIRQIVYVFINSEWNKLIHLCPQVIVSFHKEKFQVSQRPSLGTNDKWGCFSGHLDMIWFIGGEDATHFFCKCCNGEYHKEYEKAPLEIKHPLHQKHSLQLALNVSRNTRECYCCDIDLREVFYCCSACDYAMNIDCVEKAPLLSIHHPKWHEHTLALFPRKTSLTCDVCALANSNSPFYICPPCDFVVHLKCINLPRVIRISRHPHRIYYTPSFDEGIWSCGVCRRKIDNDYGSYSCIRDGCLYAVHSRCATQSNVWDGIDLEGEPEEIEEEEVQPFVRISDGIIRHFSHDHHHLNFDENMGRDYDENKQCQACITPIYFGNFYSCIQCEFVLHETCANLSRKIYHPIHQHQLTLATVEGNDHRYGCYACHRLLIAGFFYECGKEGCSFKLHVQCAIIYEPLVHESHKHPLFLTSKPGETRICHVCGGRRRGFYGNDTFNCIDECDGFALCFDCATLPPKVSYKHDKHILSLSYGDETSTMTYWCEACETKINPKGQFYMCDEYCCVTLHIECLVEKELYMKPGSLFFYDRTQVRVLSNNHHMSRPICSKCKKRCPYKILFKCSRSIFCSMICFCTNSSLKVFIISARKWPMQ